LTAITAALSHVDLGAANFVLALVIAAGKAT